MKNIEQRLVELCRLKRGWDGHNAEKISPHAINAVAELFEALYIVPGSDGSLQVEAHIFGFDLEIDFDANGNLNEAFLEMKE